MNLKTSSLNVSFFFCPFSFFLSSFCLPFFPHLFYPLIFFHPLYSSIHSSPPPSLPRAFYLSSFCRRSLSFQPFVCVLSRFSSSPSFIPAFLTNFYLFICFISSFSLLYCSSPCPSVWLSWYLLIFSFFSLLRPPFVCPLSPYLLSFWEIVSSFLYFRPIYSFSPFLPLLVFYVFPPTFIFCFSSSLVTCSDSESLHDRLMEEQQRGLIRTPASSSKQIPTWHFPVRTSYSATEPCRAPTAMRWLRSQ